MSKNTADPYDQLHARSLSDSEGFWGEVAEAISWIKR
jgi:propionyl-CoA synthetase